MAPSCAGCCWSIGSHGVGVWIVDGNENSSARNDFDLAGGQQQQPQGGLSECFRVQSRGGNKQLLILEY